MDVPDLLVQKLVAGPEFKGKWRLVEAWAAWRGQGLRRIGRARLDLDLRSPYEYVVWAHREEETELRRLRSILRSGDIFVDCGANIGLWTLSAADVVGPKGRVIAIEPHPETFRRLTAHVAALSRQNVRLINSAADSLVREVSFDLTCAHNCARVGRGSGRVSTVRLDDVVGRADGIKIDVEGAELDVLKGAGRLLSTHSPWIFVEFNSAFAGSTRIRDWPVHEYLLSHGYRAHEPSSDAMIDDDWDLDGGYRNLLYSVPARHGSGKPKPTR